jgi:hypothetical protein
VELVPAPYGVQFGAATLIHCRTRAQLANDDEETQILGGELLEADQGEVDPRVFSTSPDDPGAGRTFVWARTKWFEREEGDSGAVEFSPLEMSEAEIRDWLRDQDLEVAELDDEFSDLVRDEFRSESSLYPEPGELETPDLAAEP